MPRQTNFGGGEIAPMSWGRSDRPFFGRGARTMRNFFPAKGSGAAVSRPGSRYITLLRGAGAVRLIPFVYSDDLSFCLEVGTFISVGVAYLYVRFFRNGAQLEARYMNVLFTTGSFVAGVTLTGSTSGATAKVLHIQGGRAQITTPTGVFVDGEILSDGHGNTGTVDGPPNSLAEPFELREPLEAPDDAPNLAVDVSIDLAELRFAQVGSALYLAHPLLKPRILRRWQDISTWPNWSFSDVETASRFPYFKPSVSAPGGYPMRLDPVGTPDTTHQAREWKWKCSLVVRDRDTGQVLETLPWDVVEQWDLASAALNITPISTDEVAVYPDMPVTILRGNHVEVLGAPGAATAPAAGINFPDTTYVEVAWNIYRGRGTLFGFVGSSTSASFVDVGKEPDYATPPLSGTSPFQNYPTTRTFSGLGTGFYKERPGAIAFYQERLAMASTVPRGSSLFFSATGDYRNFDLPLIVVPDGSALLYELAARRYEQIVHLVTHQKLIVGTRSSVWTMSGAQGGVLDSNSVDARVVDEVGMTNVPPLLVENLVLFCRAKGSGVRALQYDGKEGVYAGIDFSSHAEHFFLGSATDADGVVHTKQLVDWTYAEDPWGLVWAVRSDGLLLSCTVGEEGYGWARHEAGPSSGSNGGAGIPRAISESYMSGPLSFRGGGASGAIYKNVCSIPEGDEDAVYVVVVRAINGSIRYCVERMESRLRRGNAYDDGCLDSSVLFEGAPSLWVGGLLHLDGESVYVAGVGNAPQGPYVVAYDAGRNDWGVTLGELPTANNGTDVVLYVGLSYVCDLELLDVVSAESRLKQKTVTRVGFEVDESAGILLGQDFEHLTDSRPNTVDSGWTAPVPSTQIVTVNPARKWDTGGRACLRQSLPRPVTVVGAVRELDVGG